MHSVSIRRTALRVLLPAFLLFAFLPASYAATADAVEYYNQALDHYFVTANADEIAKLDAGVFVGWRRTKLGFKVFEPADTTANALAVCRFYGNPDVGLDSHFYSASTAECEEVAQKFPLAWVRESDNVFRVFLPNMVTGQCPVNSAAVYRSWNHRADSNHRYTTDTAVHDAMIAKGYVAEGYGPGPRPVAMCVPAPPGTVVPACTLSPSSNSVAAGGSVLLNAFCTGNPTSYTWTNCTSGGPQCTASSATAGGVTYTVVATNAAGAGTPATTLVTWTTPPPPPPPPNPPVCSVVVTSQQPSPALGSLLVLQSYCNGDPTSYQWTGCISSTNICLVRSSTPGPAIYTLVASNAGGSSNLASASVTWMATPQPAAGECAQFPNALYTDVGTGSVVAYTLFSELPAFAWNGVWSVRFTVPPTAAPGAFGALQVAEFGGQPTFRDVTLSTTPCDFRPTDPTGVNGPLAAASGLTAAIQFVAGAAGPPTPGLAPGGTYYFNVRNYQRSAGFITCASTPGRCDALANISLPR